MWEDPNLRGKDFQSKKTTMVSNVEIKMKDNYQPHSNSSRERKKDTKSSHNWEKPPKHLGHRTLSSGNSII